MEQPSDLQWDLVIKVKYGDSLKRIGAFVHGQLMDPNMSKLRDKIISLFKFSQDADLILTYTDEDGDVVMLDDDHDLHDAVIGQHLNPFRITVQLKHVSHDPNVRPETSSSAKSQQAKTLPPTDEPLNSDTSPMTLSSIDINVDAQKSLSYPCGSFLTSTTPAFKLFEHEKEGGGSHLDGNIFAPSAIVFPPNNLAPHNSESLPTRVPALANVMFGYPDIIHTYVPSPSKTGINSHSEVPISKQVGVSPSEILQSIIPTTHPYQQSNIYNENTQQTYHRGVQCDGCGIHPIVGPRFKSTVKEDYDLCDSCFTKMSNASDYKRTDYAPHHTTGPLKELDNHVDLAASAAADFSSFQSNLNLNLPPVSNGRNVSGFIDIKTEPLSNGYTKTYSPGTNVENSPSAPISDFANGFSGADGVSKYSPTGVDPDLASYPLIDLPASSSMVDTFQVVTAAAFDDNVVEETLLKELEAMGFKQNDLNREILRRNEYDLEQSVDDLCDYAEWGPILRAA